MTPTGRDFSIKVILLKTVCKKKIKKKAALIKIGRQSLSDLVNMVRRAYPSDLSDREWEIIEPLSPQSKLKGRKRDTDLREEENLATTGANLGRPRVSRCEI